MTVETATYISQLSPTQPLHTDGLNQADSHLRLIKSTLQATFPAITGPVTATHTALNGVTTTNSDVALLKTNRVRNDIAQVIAGPLTVSGYTDTTSVRKLGAELVPTGIIAMWAGIVANIPAGWHLCDGTGGTPNLVDRFIVGAGSSPVPGQTGGQNIQTLTSSAVGPHSHGGSVAAVGSHSHAGGTAGYALQVSDIPSHSHTVNDPGHGHIVGTGGASVVAGPNPITLGGPGITSSGVTTSNVSIAATGGGAAHAHGIVLDGAHAHSIAADGSHSHTLSIDVRPSYFAVCYIMKL